MTVVRPGTSPDPGDGNANTQSPRTKFEISKCKQIELTSLNEWSVDISLICLRHIYSMFCSSFISDCLLLGVLLLPMEKDQVHSRDTRRNQTVTNEDQVKIHTHFLERSLDESWSWAECLHRSAAAL